eukprot:5189308-Amphidinium_carterae.1
MLLYGPAFLLSKEDVTKLKEASSSTRKTMRSVLALEVDGNEYYKGKLSGYLSALPALLSDLPALQNHINTMQNQADGTCESCVALKQVLHELPKFRGSLPIHAEALEQTLMQTVTKYIEQVGESSHSCEFLGSLSEVVAELAVLKPLDTTIPEWQTQLAQQMQEGKSTMFLHRLQEASEKVVEAIASNGGDEAIAASVQQVDA